MTLGTPALLFGAIALIMLAHNNRFFVLAKLIRDMHAHLSGEKIELEQRQIPILRLRLKLIKYMQAMGVASFLICTVSMFFIFLQMKSVGEYLFGASVLCLMGSLILALWEVMISTNALDMLLNDFDLETTMQNHRPKDEMSF